MLYLWMPERSTANQSGTDTQDRFRWRTSHHSNLSHSERWQTSIGWDALLAATSLTGETEAMVYFPTSTVQMLRQTMSKAQVRHLGVNGVRYLLEEYSLTPIDQLDVRYQHHGSELTVMAKPQFDIANLLSVLGLAPWRIAALLPDFLLLPQATGSATLLLDGANRILRLDDAYAVSADHLELTLARLPEIQRIQVIGELGEQDRQLLDGQKTRTGLEWEQLELPVSEVFATERVTVKHPYNLATQTKESSVSPYWRVVAAVLIAAIGVQMLYDTVRIWRYHTVAVNTKAMAEQQFRQWFPDEHRIVDLKRQMQGHLQGAGGADMAALSLLSRVGPALSQANLPAQKIHYIGGAGADAGQLELQINAPSLSALESLRTQIAVQGLTAELGSVNTTPLKSADGTAGPNQVSGTIRVKL
jgi:general secretion pathway protein L